MKLFKKMKDGGAESTVTGYWLIEWKRFFSIVLLKFEGKSREAYHEHAFNCWNWLVRGTLLEMYKDTDKGFNIYTTGDTFRVSREDFHKVDSVTPVSWVLSFRGPWAKTWREYLPNERRERTLTSGRHELG